ncbi:hypothetical protein [Sulfurospirillum multivorans]|uniref:Uncharacterized protein n=2 Tax=Sulfurospirillum multivorans TaxID=66821 RepID=A0AA86AKT4_SULMK|nr:hypothetical protein [Sulfurospirillum multivorans]AHJ12421.1 hypothetical protein SMUL_1155 [Sulfurospirillum multivorans DSM 12446]QEH05919.1 hypothetical protein SMN_1145 [Sulfurospirillum multivorans]
MFKDDDTLNLLDKYRKNKFQEKENGQFKTNYQNNNGVPHFVWIAVVVFIGYFIITNFMDRLEEQRIARKMEAVGEQFSRAVKEEIKQQEKAIKEITGTSLKIMESTPKIQITPNTVTPQMTPKVEQTKKNVTITLTPEQSSNQKQIQKTEETEEIKPGSSSSNVGYYR